MQRLNSWRPVSLIFMALVLLSSSSIGARQLDPTIREQVTAAVMLIAVPVVWTEDGVESLIPLPIGSGTIVSPDGVVLINYHVVDQTALDEQLTHLETEITEDHPSVTLRRPGPEFILLGSDGSTPPRPLYFAILAAEDRERDIAALRITEFVDPERQGASIAPTPFIPVGDSDGVNLGDRVQIFAYPAIGGDSLTYTTGVVSGFGFDDDSVEREWISTDAVMSAGSSGGTAISDEGRLIGIPTAGSELDCRAGDTNRDGAIDESDVGCIPVGGSLGLLVPVNDAFDLLVRTGLVVLATGERSDETGPLAEPTPTRSVPTANTVGPASCDFGFIERFSDPRAYRELDVANVSSRVVDGAFRTHIKTPGSNLVYPFWECPTGGDPARFEVSVQTTSGWGDVLVVVLTADGAEWLYCVDPVARTWSLYRNGVTSGAPFYWVEPVSYEGFVQDPLRSVAVEVTSHDVSLLINGLDVTDSTGIELPAMSGSLVFGFGAGINPDSLSGSGESFEVAFDYVVLAEQ